MIAFNPVQFKLDYPQFAAFSDNTLTNNFYNQALSLGSKIIGLFKPVYPSQTWNAATNTPTLANGVSGLPYLCSVGGTVNFGAGNIVFVVNYVVTYSNGAWSNIGYPKQYYWACVVLAHIMTLYGIQGGAGGAVGRVSDATEGSVSGSFAFLDTINGTWWNQTPFGAMCWQLLKQRGGATYFAQNNYNGYPVSNVGLGYYGR